MNPTHILPTIAALATAQGKGAIHIIRLSGTRTYEIINKICLHPVNKLEKNGIQLNEIVDSFNNIIDQVLLVKFTKPHSYTGEDLIEINCHGSMLIVSLILELLIKNGAQMAQPGDFSKRAFLMDKIDLNQAEAILALIEAQSQTEIHAAVANLDGRVSTTIKKIADDLFQIIAECEINIDFPEIDDNHEITDYQLKTRTRKSIISIIEKLDAIFQNSQAQKIGNLKIVIVGRTNAGKSSLLNTIVNAERVIVSDVAGTTRDSVAIDYYFHGKLLTFVDTAGINEKSVDAIEKLGINRTYQEIAEADLIIHLIDGTDSTNEENIIIDNLIANKKHLKVYSKKDLLTSPLDSNKIYISSQKKDMNSLYEAMQKMLTNHEIDSNQIFGICSSNGVEHLSLALDELKHAMVAFNENMPLDLILENLNYSYEYLLKILNISNENLINKIFANFCVGK